MIPSYCYRHSSEWGWRNSAPIRSGLRVVTQPTGEQITLAEAKLHLRVDDDGGSPPSHPDDPLITELIVAAREWCENDTGRALVPQTLELTTSGWPSGWLTLPMSPVASVATVVYLDSAGVATTVAGSVYVLDNADPAYLYPSVGVTWPTALAAPNAITIRYLAGYSLPNASPNDNPLPKSIKSAMLLIIGALYEQREQSSAEKLETIPLAAESLLDRWRIRLAIA